MRTTTLWHMARQNDDGKRVLKIKSFSHTFSKAHGCVSSRLVTQDNLNPCLFVWHDSTCKFTIIRGKYNKDFSGFYYFVFVVGNRLQIHFLAFVAAAINLAVTLVWLWGHLKCQWGGVKVKWKTEFSSWRFWFYPNMQLSTENFSSS